MFTKAHLKLTVFYSVFFFILFWIFSFGLYKWMESSFGEGYISQVKQRQAQTGQNAGEFNDSKASIVVVAGDVALGRLANILLIFNSGLLFFIPVCSYLLARKTLAPIKLAHEQQRQFVSNASHELRTPLSIMSGEVDLALKKPRTAIAYQKILSSNKEELGRLTQLVENLLFLAREDQSRQNLKLEQVDIVDVIHSVLRQLKAEMKRKKIKLSFYPPEESLTLQGNTSLLAQLFFNLIDNAIKYTDKGEITISLSQENKYAKIAVRDSGVGISPEHQKQLFDRFYRVDSARSETKGFGLGLAIAQAIVKRHRGTITVHSGLQKGSTFTVSLPIAT